MGFLVSMTEVMRRQQPRMLIHTPAQEMAMRLVSALRKGIRNLSTPNFRKAGAGHPHSAPRTNKQKGRRDGSLCVDLLLASPSGDVCMIGWIDDELVRLEEMKLQLGNNTHSVAPDQLIRWHRSDVAKHLGSGHSLNTFGIFWIGRIDDPSCLDDSVRIACRFDQHSALHVMKATFVSDQEFLERTLDFLAGKEYSDIDSKLFSGPFLQAKSFLIMLWKNYCSKQSIDSILRYGAITQNPSLTAITVLFGSAEPIALQSRLLYGKVPPGKVEIIYVNNSPDIKEAASREAELFHQVTGHTVTVINLTDNIGFGAANDIGVKHGHSQLIAFINPDVFDASGSWYRVLDGTHRDMPADIFGAVMTYADGAVMHDGMEIIHDRLLLDKLEGQPKHLLTVNHFSKGSPPWTIPTDRNREVPAVSGAFICTTKAFHESLGGFNNDYLYGHYEDADYCLRARKAGYRVCVLRNLRLVHMEGKGSKSKPFHRGARLINRCTFTQNWYDMPEISILPV